MDSVTSIFRVRATGIFFVPFLFLSSFSFPSFLLYAVIRRSTLSPVIYLSPCHCPNSRSFRVNSLAEKGGFLFTREAYLDNTGAWQFLLRIHLFFFVFLFFFAFFLSFVCLLACLHFYFFRLSFRLRLATKWAPSSTSSGWE